MSLQLILGNSGSGKSHYIYHKMIQESIKHPNYNYYIIVPEQFTMQTQKELVFSHPNKGIMNIDILSFERLAYRVMEEVGSHMGQVLEETGKSLVLRKVAQEKKDQLKLLGGKLKKPGYITQMKSTVSELMQYDIASDGLDDMLEWAKDKPQLYYKLQDIRVIYQGFCEYLQGKYVTAEGVLDVLCDIIPQSEKLAHSILVLDGFTGFTPIQYKLIRELFQLCGQISITVTLDEREDPFSLGSPHQLFYMSRQMINKLCKLAAETGTEIEEEKWVRDEGKGRFSQSSSLQFLEKHLFRYDLAVDRSKQDQIRIVLCKNPQSEMEQAASVIGRMVREEGCRYKDFAVITGDMEIYSNYAAWAFEEAGIPYFLDEKHTVLMNPFVEYIRALIDMIVQNYSYESVFRFLRCGLSDLQEEEIDEMENYVIALGIRGLKKWKEQWVRHYRGQAPKAVTAIDGIRNKLMTPLITLTGALKQKNLKVKDAVVSLYLYIAESGIQLKLKKQELFFNEINERSLVKEYSQIYGIVMDLFDKMADVLGEETVTIREFQELLEAGLEEAKVGIIPPSTDQVLIGDMQRTRLKDIQTLFFVGVNEGMIPKNAVSKGLLSDLDREYLKGSNVEMAPTSKENIYVERFYLYLNMTKPSRNLYLSYCKCNAKGESVGAAYLIRNLQKMYSSLVIWDGEEKETLLEQLENPESGLKYLVDGLRGSQTLEPDEEWKELFSWYFRNNQYFDRLQKLVTAAFYTNPVDRISKSVAHALYGKVLENSATRLEKFAACAFAHFLEHGLGIRERAQYEFTPVDLGNVVHHALEKFSEKLRNRGIEWKNLREEQRLELVDESVEDIIHDYGNTILHSSARNKYMIDRVKRMMNRTVWALQEQIVRGEFIPSRFEVSFAMADSLKSVNIALSKDEKMKLKGRIDRMDICEDEEHVYVKVIDYKSGNTSFDLVALYHGLQLQLVVYLNAALEIEQHSHPNKTVQPAGIFYYNVKDPVVDKIEGEAAEDLNSRILKELRMNGLVLDEAEVLEKLDGHFSPQGQKTSLVIPAAYNKDGSLTKASSAVNSSQFEVISHYVNHKIKHIGKEILDGDAKAAPYELGKQKACTYCPYRPVCGFDDRIPGYEFRRLQTWKPEDIWKKMKEE